MRNEEGKENKMSTNNRERAVRRGRKILSDERLDSFFAMLSEDEPSRCVLAVKLLREERAEGASYDEIFYTGDSHGYHLQVKKIEGERYEIDFGCQVTGTAGDGGVWEVLLKEEGIESIELKSMMLS